MQRDTNLLLTHYVSTYTYFLHCLQCNAKPCKFQADAGGKLLSHNTHEHQVYANNGSDRPILINRTYRIQNNRSKIKVWTESSAKEEKFCIRCSQLLAERCVVIFTETWQENSSLYINKNSKLAHRYQQQASSFLRHCCHDRRQYWLMEHNLVHVAVWSGHPLLDGPLELDSCVYGQHEWHGLAPTSKIII